MDQNCPICLENLFYSRESSIILDCCKNFIHIHCFNKLFQNRLGLPICPICAKSLYKMTKEEIEYYDNMIVETKETLPTELKDKKVNILCNDCLTKTENIDYHPFGLKCSICGSYNTKM